jgi:arginyl-tRNA synthetase
MLESLTQAITRCLKQAAASEMGLTLDSVVVEVPSYAIKGALTIKGDLASPVCFELAKRLKAETQQKVSPRELAEKLLPAVSNCDPSIERVEVAGPGYLNFFYDRAAFLKALTNPAQIIAERLQGTSPAVSKQDKTIIEHTAINPNKAAHIGHVRNALIGDTVVRMMRAIGEHVEIQNYIDNTGVQVADVVVGFIHIEGKSIDEVKEIEGKFDYYCWDLYSKVGAWYEESPERKELRGKTLHEIEEGDNPTAELAEHVSRRVLHCHLDTMTRINVFYDVLPRESDILHLHFWDYAFKRLKESGTIVYEDEGRNKGCWVMKAEPSDDSQTGEGDASQASEHDMDKVIVRSNGTVTYAGKDIAFTLWKLGQLGMDFYYHPFYTYQDSKKNAGAGQEERVAWITTSDPGEDEKAGRPSFGNGVAFFNVIDIGQAYTQQNVLEGARRIAPDSRIERSGHLAYEKVSLTPASAQALGAKLKESDLGRKHIGMSGRKGLGVKADDLIDQLEANALAQVQQRHPALAETEQHDIARVLAVGALRYFLLKYTRTTVIAFDFNEALAFEGETGIYIVNAAVRLNSIFRKLKEANIPTDHDLSEIEPGKITEFFSGGDGDELWSLLYWAARLPDFIAQGVIEMEPAVVSKYAFQLAQRSNVFYQKYHILTEPDASRRALLIHLAKYLKDQLTAILAVLGIDVPERM